MKKPIPKKVSVTAELQSEASIRAAVAEVRDSFATLDEAELSPAWLRLRPAVEKWALEGWAKPNTSDPEWPRRIARIYLRRSELLPPIAPDGAEHE
jgi:hypothetical protein